MMKAFHMSETGARHLWNKKVCQDSSASFSDEYGTVAVVSDGHGCREALRSQIGSAMACEAAVKNIRLLLKNISSEEFLKNPEEVLTQLEVSIINDWNEAVRTHYEANPFTDSELSDISEQIRYIYSMGECIENAYGATLIASAAAEDFWFAVQIGDGKCVAVDSEGICSQPVPWDDKCFLNITTSLCDEDAIHDFRHYYSETIPTAVLVGTDGIDTSFTDNEALYAFYQKILYGFSISDAEDAYCELKEYLPRLSKQGSGDDVSIAAWMDMAILQEVVAQIRERESENTEREKENSAKAEEEKREENSEKPEEEKEIEEDRKEQESEKEGKDEAEKKYEDCRKINDKNRPHPKFCCMCGAKLLPGLHYCECGARVLVNTIKPNAEPFYIEKAKFIYRLEKYLMYHS